MLGFWPIGSHSDAAPFSERSISFMSFALILIFPPFTVSRNHARCAGFEISYIPSLNAGCSDTISAQETMRRQIDTVKISKARRKRDICFDCRGAEGSGDAVDVFI